jgi:hypothetical protein
VAACLATGVSLAGATASGSQPGANAVTVWNANAGEAAIAACSLGGHAPLEARMYAMTHAAIHDALNGIDRRSRPYAASLTAAPGASPEAAVAAAARDVLVPVLGSLSFFLSAACVDAGIASVEADYTAALGAIPNGTAKTRGVALGHAAAAAILALRSVDGYDTPLVDPNYQEGAAPGEYRYTPGTPFAFVPGLGEDLTPFVLEDGSQFRPGPPYSLPAASTPRTSTRSSTSAATTSRLPATGRPTRPRSPSSGSRARHSRGIGSPGRSRTQRDSTPGRARGCSAS